MTAQTAQTAPELYTANEFDEVYGGGPEWRCARYAYPGHNYQECRDCHRHFDRWMEMKRGRAALTGGAA